MTMTADRQSRIIEDLANLPPIVAKYRQAGQKIVLTQGSFDLVHIGHARYCEEAKRHGDVLIVGVDSDEKVRARKGPERPVVPHKERLEMLTYLRSVDIVVLKHLDEPKWALIKIVRPDVLIATKETYSDQQLEDLKQWCKKIIVLDPMATTSTSAKIRRLQIGAAKKISATLSDKLIRAMEEVLDELKAEQ